MRYENIVPHIEKKIPLKVIKYNAFSIFIQGHALNLPCHFFICYSLSTILFMCMCEIFADCLFRHHLQNINSDKIIKLFRMSFRSDQSLSCVRLFATPWIAARQPSLSITNSRSSLRLTSIRVLNQMCPSGHGTPYSYTHCKFRKPVFPYKHYTRDDLIMGNVSTHNA